MDTTCEDSIFSTSTCEQLSLCRLILQIVCMLQKFEKFATFLVVDEFHQTGKLSSLSSNHITNVQNQHSYACFSNLHDSIINSVYLHVIFLPIKDGCHMVLILHDLSFCLFQDILYSELVYLALVALTTYPPYMF